MARDKREYAVRYRVEKWGKPAEGGSRRVAPGVRVSPSEYGYTDLLFVASVLRNPDGTTESILVLDSDSQGPPSREVAELVRDYLNHYMEAHT